MPELLKNYYNDTFVKSLGAIVKNTFTSFDLDAFCNAVIDMDWEAKELKERMRHITVTLHSFLPLSYPEQINILKETSTKTEPGFYSMIFPDFVEVFGLNNWNISVSAMEFFTQTSSSEFAVRPFIIKDQEKMMNQMKQWSFHSNYHVRRLASEGCRPRLPWAMALPALKKDPSPILPILERLKSDPEEYVRRSVANNLNDISKDHPDLVIDLSKKWIGTSKDVDRVVKHACRGLLKKQNKVVLKIFGFTDPGHISIKSFMIKNKKITIGDKLEFGFSLNTEQEQIGKVRLEYAIEYVKANGKRSKKVFQISESIIKDKLKDFTRVQSFKNMTTRKHYPGKHFISIIVNGEEKTKDSFILAGE